MSSTSHKNTSQVAQLNISYYDEIANSYDEILNRQDSNRNVRQWVKERITSLVQPGQWVLDFGGGTGLDLHWLAANKYKILFCEPSALMREKAIKSYSNTRDVIYLDSDKTDFTTWHKAPPFSQKVDAILADFGVINCIPDIDFLFRNLAVVIKPNGHFLAVFLDRSLKKMWSWHRRNAVRSLLFNSPFIMYVQHREHRQTVFVHSIEEVKRASAKYFDCAGHESLGNSGFVLIHLTRK